MRRKSAHYCLCVSSCQALECLSRPLWSHKQENAMKLFQASWLLGILSFVVVGALTRFSSPLADLSLEMQWLVTIFLVILPAGIGTVLGVISSNRKETTTRWLISIIVLNVAMLLAGIVHLFPG